MKHLKRCGGGTVKDVIDTTKLRRQQHVNAILAGVPSLAASPEGLSIGHQSRELSQGPPNVTVMMAGGSTGGGSSRESSETREDVTTPALSDTTTESEHNAPIQQHFCSTCPFIANSVAELKRHQRVHSEDKPFICKTCGYCSKWKCDLKKHLRTYGHESAVPLIYGGHGRKPADWDKEKEKMEQQLHKQENGCDDETKEAGPIMYRCEQCPYMSSKPNLLEAHKYVHDQNASTSGKLKCKQCDFSVDDLPAILQHKILHQSVKREEETEAQSPAHQSAPTAAASYRHRRKPLKQNITKTVQDDSEDEVTGGYACDWCMFTADRSIDLYEHVKSHHHDELDNGEGEKDKEDVFSCDWCTWTTNKSSEMLHHVNTEHQQDIMSDADNEESINNDDNDVDEDDGETAEINIYRGESRKVAKRRLKHCIKCAYVTDNISTLQRHTSKHGKNAKYRCNYCDYSVEREHIIEYHMNMVHKNNNGISNGDVTANGYDDMDEHSMDSEAMYAATENMSPLAAKKREDDDHVSAEWDIVEVNAADEEENPTKRRRLSRLSVNSAVNSVLKYCCKVCSFSTTNKANLSQHNHNNDDPSKDKMKEGNIDINRNTMHSEPTQE